MRKKVLSVITLSAILGIGAIGLGSCDQPSNVQTETYSVTCATSSDYTVSGLQASYKSGDTVTFQVTVTNSEKEIASVAVNGTVINGTNGSYSFQMPATNVTIVVTLKDVNGGGETPVEEHKVTVSASQTSVSVGSSTTLVVYLDGAIKTSGYTVTADKPELVTIDGNVVTGVAEGNVTITVTFTIGDKTYSGTVSLTITKADFITIAEAKTKAVGTAVKVRGVVTASGGTSAYISDETDGIYVYNWYYGANDTAITDKKWTVGQSVEVYAELAQSPNGGSPLQLSSYSNGAKNPEFYAIALDTPVTAMDPIEIDEAGYNNLKITDVGKMYKFKAYYVSGAPESSKAASVTFKMGENEVTLRTDGGSSAMYDKDIDQLIADFESLDLQAGDEVEITAPLSWYYDPQFGYISHGTTITKTGESIDIGAPEEGQVYYLEDIYEFDNNMTYTGRAYYMGHNDLASSKGTMTYNAVFVADGSNYYMLYNVDTALIDEEWVPGQTIIEWDGTVSDYNGIKESKVSAITKVDTDSTLVTPVVPTLNAENQLTLGESLMSARVKIEGATVKAVSAVGNTTKTITFTVGTTDYDLYLDNRYNNLNGTLAGNLKVGDVFDTYSFVSKNNDKYQFVYVNELTVQGGGTVTPPEPVTLSKIGDLYDMQNGTEFVTRGYWMGRCNKTYSGDTVNYNAGFISDGEDSFMLYRLNEDLIKDLNLIPGETVIEVTGNIAHYVNGDYTTYEGTVTSVTVVEDSTIVKPVITTINEANPTFEFSDATMNDKVKIENAKVTSLDRDNYDNLTINFSFGSNVYTLYLDSRYSDVTAFDDVEVGSSISLNTWVGASKSGYQFIYYEDLSFTAPVIIEPTSVELTTSKSEIKINETTTLSYTVTPTEANVEPTFESLNPTIASVDETGTVKGLAAGKATIKISFDGTEVTDTVEITVLSEELVINSVAYTYTPDFYDDNTVSSQSYSGDELTVNNAVETLNNTSNTVTTSLIDEVTSISKVYAGRKGAPAGIKLSTSSVAGSISFTLTENITQMKISVIAWKNDTPNFSINGESFSTVNKDGVTIETFTATFDTATKTIEIKAGKASKCRFAIVGMEFILA